MQKLSSYMVIVFFLLLYGCATKNIEREAVVFKRSIAIDGNKSLDWKMRPLYIDGKLYQPGNIFELKNEIHSAMEQEFFYSLRDFARESFKKINLIDDNCYHLGDQLTHFYDEYFKFMKRHNQNNAEYHIYGISWMADNWSNIKRIQKKSPMCQNGSLSKELYLYGLFYMEAINVASKER